MAVVCPRQVRPAWPARAAREGVGGFVLARATIRGGRVVQVEIVESRPRRLFDAAVREAMLQYRCETTGAADVTVEQPFEFKLEE
jgi:protein TonB